MLLALVGVTGVGKSYFKELIVKELGFKRVNTIRTRAKRVGESDGLAGLFMTKEELDVLEKEDKLAYRFSVFGGEYAYLKDEIFSKDDMIFEMHYTTIDDWKNIRDDIKTIYIFPSNLELAKQKTRERNLSKEKEIERIAELEEHYNTVMNSEELQQKFDYIVYNNYDEKSKDEILELVKNLKEGSK